MTQVKLAAFFSYSREDSEFALRLAGDLKAAGANVWLDQLDITPGQRWDSAVEEALKNCPRLIVVLSPAAVKSQNVMDEVSFALEERKTVIPVIHRDCDIPFRLRRVQHADFRQDYARPLQGLIGTLIPAPGAGQGTPAISDVRSGGQSSIDEAGQRQHVAEQQRLDDERRKPTEDTQRLGAEARSLSHLLGPVLIDTAYVAALWTVISIIASYLSDQFQHAPHSRAAVANWVIWIIEQYFAGLIVVTVLRRFRPTFRRIHLALLALVWPAVYVVTLTMIRWLGEEGPLLAVGEALVGAVAGLILSMDLEERPWNGALVGAVSFGIGQLVARLILNSVQAGLAVNSRYIVDTVHFFTCGILEAGPLVWYLHFRASRKVDR